MNPMNPEHLARGRQIVAKIKENLGEFAILERAASLAEASGPIEKAYRLAEVKLEQAKRKVGELDASLKEVDGELFLRAAGALIDDGKPKYGTEQAKKSAALAMRKTDEEYLLIKVELDAAKRELDAAEVALADAKSDQKALVRAHEQLLADKSYISACVASFKQFDAPAPAPAASAA